MSNGLLPVSSPLTCIKKSKVSEYVVFSEEVTPESIAKAVKSINTEYFKYDNSI